ncbi:ABC transporter permease [Ectothiorhodospira mobilis]|uniref:ABC transporter permease n=1 Tax=Ectothiorhodospira mobilis TaxID=195064 RepID=UPI00190873C3|nr:FtsX-like permease family protein [Ectothiorhodospira mobilis]MBK1690861.1 ABC transporter permease [Ectothiorhodospira mobilis]
MSGILRESLQALGREWRSGAPGILVLALVVAVGAVTSVGLFTDRVQGAVDRQAAVLQGADLVISARQPPPENLSQRAHRMGLETVRTAEFRSVLFHGERTQLAELKAVEAGWPLRGTARVADAPFAGDRPARGVPAPGEAWVQAPLLQRLGVDLGVGLEVGEATLTLTRVISDEPGRGGELFQMAPRLLFNHADLARTGLIVPGSRVDHRLLLAGPAEAIQAFRTWAETRVGEGTQIRGVDDARPELRRAIDRSRRFLGLAALMAVLLAGAAVAVAARHDSARQADAVAVMRCLGASRRRVTAVFALRMLWIVLLAGAAGILLGGLAQAGLAALVADWFGTALPAPSLRPLLPGLGVAAITALGFALPPLLTLGGVPPLRVLRRDLAPPAPSAWLVAGLALIAFAALVFWQAGDPVLAGWVLAGTLGLLGVLLTVAWGLVRVLGRLRTGGGVALRFGLANLARRGGVSALQLAAFGVGIMALLLLAVVRVDLLSTWEGQLPDTAPDHFLINVQPDEVAPIQDRFREQGRPAPDFHPLIRARLVAIAGEAVRAEDFAPGRARRLATREFNLSHTGTLQADNRIVAGQWWGADGTPPGFSVEADLARTLGITLGDRLTFRVEGERVSAPVTSLRQVDWDSFNVNFFVLASPGLLQEHTPSFVASFYLGEEGETLLSDLARRFPSATVLDVGALLERIRRIVDRATLAVEYVFLFTLAAGVMVLLAAIQSTRDLRRRETAVLRTLGATRGQIRAGLLAEFVVLGALAGLLAAAGASAGGALLASRVFDLPYGPDPLVWILGTGGGALGVGLAGWLGVRPVLRQPPLWTLRGVS